ncbi:MAG: HNH endonuclease [Betaproteobacteria bacterium]|nr:HNH endonuclease [Betaproteobacteria bacterium]
MTKLRVPIPPEIAAATLFASDHTCCYCRERGRPVQIHHIDEDPSNNGDENLAVLCLLCHNDTQIKGGFGRKLNIELVIQYRNDWLTRVLNRRNQADELAAVRMSGPAVLPSESEEDEPLMEPADEKLVSYVSALPKALAEAYRLAQPLRESPNTFDMIQGSYDVIDVVVQMLTHLASWLPEKHFDGRSSAEYFSEFVSIRFIWHRALAEPCGVGTGGTIVGPATAAHVLRDVEQAVAEMVTALLWGREGFGLKSWHREWQQPGQQ